MEIATNGFKRHAPSDKEHREPRAGLVHKLIERGISVTATGVRRACCSLKYCFTCEDLYTTWRLPVFRCPVGNFW
jgi:hypothetical protein